VAYFVANKPGYKCSKKAAFSFIFGKANNGGRQWVVTLMKKQIKKIK